MINNWINTYVGGEETNLLHRRVPNNWCKYSLLKEVKQNSPPPQMWAGHSDFLPNKFCKKREKNMLTLQWRNLANTARGRQSRSMSTEVLTFERCKVNAALFLQSPPRTHHQIQPNWGVFYKASDKCFSKLSRSSKMKPAQGLPWWLSGKESTCQCRRRRFDP